MAFSLTTSTYNDSLVNAPASWTGLYLSTNSTISTGDSFLGSASVPLLAPLRSYTRTGQRTCAFDPAKCHLLGWRLRRLPSPSRRILRRRQRPRSFGALHRHATGSRREFCGRVFRVGMAGRKRRDCPDAHDEHRRWRGPRLRRLRSYLSSDSTITLGDDCLGWHSVPVSRRDTLLRSKHQRSNQSLLQHEHEGCTTSAPTPMAPRGSWREARATTVAPIRSAADRGLHRLRALARLRLAEDVERHARPTEGPRRRASPTGMRRSVAQAESASRRVADSGRLAVIMLSGSGTFSFDAWANLSLAVPLFSPVGRGHAGIGAGLHDLPPPALCHAQHAAAPSRTRSGSTFARLQLRGAPVATS